jgi:magnesium transporter
MTEYDSLHPWDRLADLVTSQQAAEVRALIEALPPGDIPRAVSRLSDEDQRGLLALLGPEESAALFEFLSDAQTVGIFEDLPPEQAAAIVEELPSAERADLLAELPSADAAAILEHMPVAEATDTRILLQYPPDTAGGLMITEYVSYPDRFSVGDVVDDLRTQGERYSDYEIQYCYVTDADARLIGVLRLRDLLMAPHTQPVRTLMVEDPLHVQVDDGLDSLKQFVDDHPFVGVPVTDDRGILVGVVRRSAVESALGDRATEAFLAVTGLIGEDELRTMPVLHRARRRLSWLSINIVLNVIAASVIAFYQDTLAAVIALAVFLPIISDMSGCSGNQAVAVSIRELTLGLLKPYEFFRVIAKEGAVGLINGLALGVLLGGVAVLWKGNMYLGLVVGSALLLNTLLAVLLGGLIPLALKALKQDPALASGPILTTVTDMVGFFLVLSFASVMLTLLV